MTDAVPPVSDIQKYFASASFTQSAAKLAQCPLDEGLETAFAGRSNAGKSSAINRLTGQKKLARTSKTPGRTQQPHSESCGNVKKDEETKCVLFIVRTKKAEVKRHESVVCVLIISSHPPSGLVSDGLLGTGRLKSRHMRDASHWASKRFRSNDISAPSGKTMVNIVTYEN